MPKIRKTNLPNKASQNASPYSPIFSRRTKILLFTGLTLILIPIIFYLNQSIQLMYFVPDASKISQVKTTAASPTEIHIPAVQISLPVAQTTIRNNSWGVSGNGASHLNISANPGEPGPIILYAHNTDNRFGPIRWLQAGNEIFLSTTDGKIHAYKVKETVVVNPDELSVFFKRHGETLYLYTCDGFADLKRFIVIAEPV